MMRYLNDIQRMAVTEQHYLQAWADAGRRCRRRFVRCRSRHVDIRATRVALVRPPGLRRIGCGSAYRVGAMVLSNFGRLPQLLLAGHAVGARLARRMAQQAISAPTDPEKGSIIALIATDAPLDARQLRRLALRAGAGLARTGSVFGHGSGDIALAFSTAYTVPQQTSRAMPAIAMVHDALIDPLVSGRRRCNRAGDPACPAAGSFGNRLSAVTSAGRSPRRFPTGVIT
jgi:D-aminopeptidase